MRVMNLGGVLIRMENYFANADEANEWLNFDEEGEELTWFDYSYPDQFAEWIKWRDTQ